MNDKKYLIYKHTSPSGKIYIGQTCTSCNKRWGLSGNKYSDSPHFYRAIQKYGWNNFKHEILYIDLTLQEANYLERYLILYYESYNQDKGYNISLGGMGTPGVDPWNKGKELPEEMKDKIRKGSLNRKDISKEVMCVETGIIYPSAYEAQRQTEIDSGHIRACCIGTRITAGGYHWKRI